VHLIRARAGRPSVRRTGTFTGDVWGDPVSEAGTDPTVNTVMFAPGARTYWHRHEGGQLIVVTHGVGLVIRDDGLAIALRAGESVWTPGGEAHCHGAGPDSLLCHTAYSFGETQWLGELGDEDYESGARIARDGRY
jgi:quercetin dioxygenase-like cupin family protein